jgi:TRAP-type C4-dicarboxylate transport system permease small subunit
MALLAWWCYKNFVEPMLMETPADAAPANPYLWIARAIIIGSWLLIALGVWHAWRTHPKFFEETEEQA